MTNTENKSYIIYVESIEDAHNKIKFMGGFCLTGYTVIASTANCITVQYPNCVYTYVVNPTEAVTMERVINTIATEKRAQINTHKEQNPADNYKVTATAKLNNYVPHAIARARAFDHAMFFPTTMSWLLADVDYIDAI